MELDAEKIKSYLQYDKYDFKTFSMDYTISMKKTIDRLDLKVNDVFAHFGSIKDIVNLNQFLSKLGTNTTDDIKSIETLIMSIIRKVLKGYTKKHFWMDIRVTQPDHDFDIPRWHKDGNFFLQGPIELHTSKFATVLKGPGTLLIKGTKKVNQIYNENLIEQRKEYIPTKDMKEQSRRIHKKYRPILAKKLANEKVIQVKNTQGVIFFAGNPREKAALHSEPPNDAPRLFISILPSTEANIKDLKERWNK